MKNQKVAIIGAGTAGLAVASFLKMSGHSVTLFEKFDTPKPLGAGLLLQPSGLAALSLLGLDEDIIEKGSKISRLHGKVAGRKCVTMDVRYKDLAPHLFGVGTHRGNLFSSLYNKMISVGVNVITSTEITDIIQENSTSKLINASGESWDGFDIVVDASGQKSTIRNKYANIKIDKQYPYGALWAIVKLDDDIFESDVLDQKYKNANHMIGVLPVGKLNGDECTSAAFFWSMKICDLEKWKSQTLEDWKKYVVSLWPETEHLVSQFKSHDDLTFATYRDVVLRQYYVENIVFIGDSAHCTSPQLGQGANLALIDAVVLAECINEEETLGDALKTYNKKRQKHVWFYQWASRLLTPFFQSDSWVFAKLRVLICDIPCKIPPLRKISAHVLSGTKVGFFSSLNISLWSEKYDFSNKKLYLATKQVVK